MRYLEIKNQELQNEILQIGEESKKKLRHQEEEILSLRQQEDNLKASHKREIEKLNGDFDEVVMRMKAKYEEKK